MTINRADKNDIHEVLMSFVDHLFEQSHYFIFEKPKHSKTVNLSKGYRSESRSVGSDRKKAINYVFQLISPSRSEIELYVKNWVTVKLISEIPDSKDSWSTLATELMDDFILEYLVTEAPQTSKDGSYFLGYRANEKREESKVNFFLKFLQPNKSEIELVIQNWLKVMFSS